MRLIAPENVTIFLRLNEAFSVSGHPSRGEGGDFVLENKNKRLKRLIPNGLPTEATWTKACRTFDTLDGVSIYFYSYNKLYFIMIYKAFSPTGQE